VCALGKQPTQEFFEVSIFLYAVAGLLPAPRACAPLFFGAYTGVSIFQMALATKFKMVAACQQTKIMFLKIDTSYPIERAERVVTKYGEAILMTTRPGDIFESVPT